MKNTIMLCAMMVVIGGCSDRSENLRACLVDAKADERVCEKICTDRSAYDDNISHYGVCQKKCLDIYLDSCKDE